MRSCNSSGGKRLLFINGHLHTGGVERSLLTLLQHIDYSKYTVDLLLFEGLGEYRKEIPSSVRVRVLDIRPTYGSKVKVLRNALKKKAFRDIALAAIMRAYYRRGVHAVRYLKLFHAAESQYDAVFAYRVGLPLDYAAYAVKADRKYVWWHHGEFHYSAHQVRRWRKAICEMTGIVCVSDYTRQLIAQPFAECRKTMHVLPNMLDAAEIKEKAGAFHPYTDITKPILVSVGRFSPEKHMMDAIEVMHILKQRSFDAVWYLVGDGLEYEQVRKRILEEELTDCMILTGQKENPYPFISDADLYVHLSPVESQGIAVLEAMALGKKMVVVKSEGTKEFVTDGVNAVNVDSDPAEIADGIFQALHDREWGDTQRKAQKNTVKQYSPERLMRKFYQLIDG